MHSSVSKTTANFTGINGTRGIILHETFETVAFAIILFVGFGNRKYKVSASDFTSTHTLSAFATTASQPQRTTPYSEPLSHRPH